MSQTLVPRLVSRTRLVKKATRHIRRYPGTIKKNEVKSGDIVFEKVFRNGDEDDGVFSVFDEDAIPNEVENPSDCYSLRGISYISATDEGRGAPRMISTVHGGIGETFNNGWTTFYPGDKVYIKPPPLSRDALPLDLKQDPRRTKDSGLALFFKDIPDEESLLVSAIYNDPNLTQLLRLFGDKKALQELNEAALMLSKTLEEIPAQREALEDVYAIRFRKLNDTAVKEALKKIQTHLAASVYINKRIRGELLGTAVTHSKPGEKIRVFTD